MLTDTAESVEELEDTVKRELIRIRRRIETIMLSGKYEELEAIARDIILLEVSMSRRGILETFKEEIIELKEAYVRAYIVARLTPTTPSRAVWRRSRRGK